MLDQATIRKAVDDTHAVYHICPNVNPDEFKMGRIVITAAESAGIERFVFHSVLHPQVEAMPHHWNKMRVEETLFESGLQYTILQPAPYMQNVLAGWQTIVERGAYMVPYSVEARISMVDLNDVAEAAAIVLADSGYTGATYELAGPEALTQTQVADVISAILELPVRAEPMTTQEWTHRTRSSGMGAYQIDTLVKMFEYYDKHGLWGNSRVLQQLIGRPPTTFRGFLGRIRIERTST
jgi:uncharacterized protein YbjT (DUF2867 family)